jgi:hypothetical protein
VAGTARDRPELVGPGVGVVDGSGCGSAGLSGPSGASVFRGFGAADRGLSVVGPWEVVGCFGRASPPEASGFGAGDGECDSGARVLGRDDGVDGDGVGAGVEGAPLGDSSGGVVNPFGHPSGSGLQGTFSPSGDRPMADTV